MFRGTEADLTVKAKKTQLYVCRVNDHLDNFVFSDWVKVKVLDIDKSGMPYVILMLIYIVYHRVLLVSFDFFFFAYS